MGEHDQAPRSRFHMKGNAYRGLQEFVARGVPGGLEALHELLEPATRAFFQEAFVPSTWYDAMPIEELLRSAASLARQSHEIFCRRFGDFILKRDKTGIYRAILRFASADLLVRALPLTTKRYFDFVTLTVVNLDPHSYRVTVSGVPRAIAASYIGVTTVFIQRAIEGSGGANVTAETGAPRPGPFVHGFPTVQFERHLRWDR